MLDEIAAGGRGPSDQAVLKMLLSALYAYWEKFGVLPAPIRLVADVRPKSLVDAANDTAGLIMLPEVGAEATPPQQAERLVAEAPAPYGPLGPSVDELAAADLSRQEKQKRKAAQPPSNRGGAAKAAAKPKTARR
jgi:hypothetical protein